VFGWSADEDTSMAVLDAFAAAGGNFIDTANIYSYWASGNRGGESETIIGRWMTAHGNRADMVIATKIGMRGGPDQPRGLTRETLRRGVTESLERLQTDYIDLYYAHEDDPATPLTETMSAFDELVREGLVRAVGASNYSAARLTGSLAISAANGLVRYEALQPHYNLLDRSVYEGGSAAVCRAHEIGVAPYYALARGFLSGKYRPGAELPTTPRAADVVRNHLNDRGFAVLGVLDDIAAAHAASVGQVAIAWLLAQPGVVAPIASATSVAQVNELTGASAVALDRGDLDRLTAETAVA
jgi:aryl-alcohol dehydrogenase-like predicted oxidoreductase